MTLHGDYTNKGRALAAKIAGGVTALTVTGVVAGSGHTADIPSATTLPDIEQTLTVGTPSVSGSTAALPVTLAETLAAQSYDLTELGVYASDPDEGEILFQIYQLDSAAAITAGGESVLRFCLRQTIGACGVSVTCSPAGLLVDGDLDPLRTKVLAVTAPQMTVHVTAAELCGYLNALPRLLTNNLQILVSAGELTDKLDLSGFYGSGSLQIRAESGGTISAGHGLSAYRCCAEISLDGIAFGGATAENSAFVFLYSCTSMYFHNCTFDGSGVSGAIGIRGDHSKVVIQDSTFSNLSYALQVYKCSLFAMDYVGGSGNTYGIHVWCGGVALLSGNTPATLGGGSNVKQGGLIVNAGGSPI